MLQITPINVLNIISLVGFDYDGSFWREEGGGERLRLFTLFTREFKNYSKQNLMIIIQGFTL